VGSSAYISNTYVIRVAYTWPIRGKEEKR